jgi:hypothetical protein
MDAKQQYAQMAAKREQILRENPSISPEELQAKLNPDLNKVNDINAAKPIEGFGMQDNSQYKDVQKDAGQVQDVGTSVVGGIKAVARGDYQPKPVDPNQPELMKTTDQDQQFQQDMEDAKAQRFAALRNSVR